MSPTVTPDGWPYVQDADLPVDYPVTSQALADMLDARWDAYQGSGILAPFTGWAEYGSGYANHTTHYSGMSTIQAALKPTSEITVAATPVQIATIPVGFRPVSNIATVAICYTGSVTAILRLLLDGASGMVRVTAAGASVIITTAGYVGVVATYRRSTT